MFLFDLERGAACRDPAEGLRVAVDLRSLDAAGPTAPVGAGVDAAAELTDEQVENIVRRSYQYVAMFNVNNKFALDQDFPSNTGGYNGYFAATELFDHTVQAIARPNNDTLYAGAMIDVTEAPMVLKMPAFDSVYVSLMNVN